MHCEDDTPTQGTGCLGIRSVLAELTGQPMPAPRRHKLNAGEWHVLEPPHSQKWMVFGYLPRWWEGGGTLIRAKPSVPAEPDCGGRATIDSGSSGS